MSTGRNGAAICAECGTRAETRSTDDLGCMVCLLRVGLAPVPDSVEMDENGETPANQFGTYAIVHHEDGGLWELGRGAMGVTFRAMDTTLNRIVALKIIHTGIGAGTQARERFMRGARVAAALRHPNVATIYHFGIHEQTGQFFYAMELVEGETLEERVHRTGPLDSKTTIAVAQQVAAALAEAEKRGLVHRDLKPANLMLVSPNEGTTPRRGDESGTLRVKIIDFGLAKAIGAHGDPMSLTQGGFVGTPAFASPEQFGNGSLDIRSDIYSLGVTLWYALTGKTPFHGRSIDEIRNAQGSTSVPIEQLKAARVPSRLRSLLQSMVAFQPAARPDVYGLLVGLRRSRLPGTIRLALGTALILILLGLASFLLWPSHRDLLRLNKKAPINAVGTANLQAQEAYLKGRSLWAKRDYRGCKNAIEFFEKAIALDPGYAMAYSGLAETYPLIAPEDPLIARSEDYVKATAAANKAIELDPAMANPHAALGLIAMNYAYDWATAEREFKGAVDLNPDYATAHHWYAEYLITQGRSDESLAEIERAHELDPHSSIIMCDKGKILFYSRRYDEAIKVLRKAIESDPDFLQPHVWLAQIYHETGLYDKAVLEFRASERTDKLDGGAVAARFPYMTAMIGRTLAKAGRRPEAEKAFDDLQQLRKRHELEPIVLLPIYLALGEKDEIFDLLEKEYDVRSTGLTSLKVNPLYDSVRSDPRFTELMRRIGLAPPDSSASRFLAPEKSVMVLPFTNLSPNSDSAYLAEGLREQIQTRLVKLADLKIISAGMTSSRPEEIYRSATQLGMTRILQGSVQTQNDLCRVTIQLIDPKNGTHLWAENYDRKMSDLLQVEKEIAEDVASALSARLTDREKHVMNATTTSNAAAHEAYLKGRYFWNKRSWKEYEQARQFFSRAIALDPNYAQAYVGLADTLQFQGADAGKDPTESYDRAKASDRKALELDPSLAEAHASLGLLAMNYDHDWSTAEREYKRAIELSPGYAIVHDWYSEYLMAVGRPEESLREMRKARELDPFSLIFKTDMGKMLFFSRRYDEAIDTLNQILKTDPNYDGSHFWLGWIYAAQSKYDQALAEFERIERDEQSGGSFGGQGYVYGMMGKRKEAEQMLAVVMHQAPNDPQPRCWIHIALGDKDKAFACLEEEFKLNATGLISLKTAPHYDSLRSDSRFANLLRRVCLPP